MIGVAVLCERLVSNFAIFAYNFERLHSPNDTVAKKNRHTIIKTPTQGYLELISFS